MSIRIMTAVWDLQLPTGDKLVAISLADQASDAGICWPSLAMIAQRCGMSERNVARVISRLESAGLIARKNRAGTSNCYEVKPADFKPVEGEKTETTPDTMSYPPLTPCHTPPDTMSGVPLTPCHTTPDTMSGEPKRTVNRTQKEPGKQQPELELKPAWLPEAEWQAFEAMRNRKGWPLTPRARKGIFAQLEHLKRAGHDPAAALRQSTGEEWQKVYPPRGAWAEAVPGPAASGSDPPESAEVTQWRYRLRDWRKAGLWLPEWGPEPNQPGNFLPPELSHERLAS